MKLFNDLMDKINLKKQVKEFKKDEKLMFTEIDFMGKEIEGLRGIIAQQTNLLTQAYSNTRDMFFGPNEFVLGPNHKAWKGIKITIGGEEITDKISKIVIFGPNFIEE